MQHIMDRILDGYLDAKQLATELHVHLVTIWKWRQRREGPPAVRVGKRLMYRRASVEKWLASREEKRS
jgi:predicted DNA-binding transcriptional regulator AlpA